VAFLSIVAIASTIQQVDYFPHSYFFIDSDGFSERVGLARATRTPNQYFQKNYPGY